MIRRDMNMEQLYAAAKYGKRGDIRVVAMACTEKSAIAQAPNALLSVGFVSGCECAHCGVKGWLGPAAQCGLAARGTAPIVCVDCLTLLHAYAVKHRGHEVQMVTLDAVTPHGVVGNWRRTK